MKKRYLVAKNVDFLFTVVADEKSVTAILKSYPNLTPVSRGGFLKHKIAYKISRLRRRFFPHGVDEGKPMEKMEEVVKDPTLGTLNNPFTKAPPDFHDEGLPYAAYCRCVRCGLVARSTFIFDYYAKNVGDPLVCESCERGGGAASELETVRLLEKERFFEEEQNG